MCGIAGYLDLSDASSIGVLDRMTDALEHRGPDARGTYHSRVGSVTVGLGHRRLSILDLSPAGSQPMHRGDLSIVFNGEVYNFGEIREELLTLGHRFQSHSDTEVILASYQEWGMAAAIKKFNGMFAFALLDAGKQRLYLARDRVGVKPLYVYQKNGLLLFGSELKALVEHPGFSKSISNQALTNYFRFGYIPPSQSIYQGARQVHPSEIVTINLRTMDMVSEKYWQPQEYFAQAPLDIDYSGAKHLLMQQLIKAFEYRMVSDVEVGVFLSGGVDSSTVAAILQSKPGRTLRTFTIGFRESEFDESPTAAEISKHIGSKHTELICDSKEAQKVIPLLPEIYDEPFGDSSAIPTVLVSRLASQHVKVALSADGGDELFGGYNRYAVWNRMESIAKQIPRTLAAAIPLRLLKSIFGNRLPGVSSLEFLKAYHNPRIDLERKTLAMSVVAEESLLARLLQGRYQPWGSLEVDCDITSFPSGSCGVSQLMQTDYQLYLPGDILTKVDRATMSTSLEGREPLLDYQLAELVFRMPLDWKIDDSERKKLLKDIAFDLIPRELIDRPKKGFSVPYHRWLMTDLKYLIDEHLSKSAVQRFGLLDPLVVDDIRVRFLAGDRRVKCAVWNLLMFQMWCNRWL